jgi:hypothetical protein
VPGFSKLTVADPWPFVTLKRPKSSTEFFRLRNPATANASPPSSPPASSSAPSQYQPFPGLILVGVAAGSWTTLGGG